MEGAAPLIVAALALTFLLGLGGCILLGSHRVWGTVLLLAMVFTVGLLGMFVTA
jgi:hypothetical protein